ncbi:MAG: WD40/YVTN/BNR-like repeat-containing protein, partial [Rhodanobacteraceae bacterium]
MLIDPADPQRMLVGNDGGASITYDGGAHWQKFGNLPVGQFYSVTYDMADPYNVYGGLQDNGAMMGSSKTDWQRADNWKDVGGGDGMYVQVDPRDNKTIYAGFQFGFYTRTGPGGEHEVRPRPAFGTAPLRWNWTTPIALSTHNQDIVYMGANRLFRSLDKAESWQAVSPDLSTSKNRGNVPYATITTLAVSPKTFGLLWAGTDDGHVWVTRDGGVQWNEVDDALPLRWVSRVEPSHFDDQRAYVSLDGYRDDDITPYVYRSDDLGKHWTDISRGLPHEAINVVREDPVNQDVLYVGTDRGVYVSLDRGKSWLSLQANLPNVPVMDLVVHPRERELIAGTHGRSVW